MTSISNAANPRWGEAQARAKAARKARRRIALAMTAVVLLGGVDFLRGFADGVRGLPRGASGPMPYQWTDATMIAVLVIGGIVTWRNWRETDEMQRRLAIETWAAIGLSGFLLNPMLDVVAHWTSLAHPAGTAWFASAVIGMAFYAWRRVRS